MKHNTTKKIFFVLITILVLILINFLYKGYVTTFQNDKSSILERIEKQIHRKEKIADNAMDKILMSLPQTKQKLFNENEYNLISQKEEITFLLYEKDTLTFWSDNIFSAPRVINEKFPEKKVINSGNGWYYVLKKEAKEFSAVAAILIQSNYKYENDYLANNFTKSFDLDVSKGKISEDVKKNYISSQYGAKLFSIEITDEQKLSHSNEIIIFSIFLLIFLCLIYLLYLLHKLFYDKKQIKKTFFLFAFIIDLLIFRVLLFYFKIPADLFNSELFSPQLYASSMILPSFGDLIINTILFFIVSLFLYKNVLQQDKILKTWKKTVRLIAVFVFLSAMFMVIFSLIQSIILDSTISYNLNQLFTLSGLSIIGLLVISFLILSYFLLFSALMRTIDYSKNGLVYSSVFIIINGLTWFFLNPFDFISSVTAIITFSIVYILYYILRFKKGNKLIYYEVLTYLLIFTALTYYILTITNTNKEIEKRKSFAHKLSSGEDPLGENIYRDIQKEILSDKTLKEKLAEYPQGEYDIKEYLTKKYFYGYWEKYKVQITICNTLDSLMMESDAEKHNCNLFFNGLIKNIGKPSSCNNLYILNYGTGGNNYLSKLDFVSDSNQISVYIELNSKFIPKGLGYPELLIDKKLFINTDLSNYSYAKYYQGNLIDAYGKYYYSEQNKIDGSKFVDMFYLDNLNGYSHLCYMPDKTVLLMISKKNGNLLDLLAPFSILFTLFTLVLLAFCLFEIILPNLKSIEYNFKNRLQISMVSIIIVSFLIIGISTFYFIRNLNEDKNKEILSEKSMSILIEMQKKLGDNDIMNDEQLAVLNNALIKFSNVFFTDINVFDTKGMLVSSSRPQIFSEGLLSERMNPEAYNQLITEKKTLFIHKENIGKLQYYSSYVPFYSTNNKILYYINLPYFAKEGELKRELSLFMTSFSNIYVFLIAITILIALFIAGRITRPLNVIREKIGNIKLVGKNEKIYWPGRDEIGGLISEYNRMIDELAESAEKLSRSERESAWRVMAMQVAHEIKNPLTPMKLSVQHLERSWKDKTPDWDIRLEKFTKNIIEQIESLSAIASEFSYFAQMPKPKNEKTDIVSLVHNSANIYMVNNNINIEFIDDEFLKSCDVFADKKQLIRVMNNILNNAVQAIGNKKDGHIKIGFRKEKQSVIVYIADNGSGISEEMKPKIFTPNFSTKSEGMGLGLAIVKGIIENSGGKIWFDSVQDTGTTFFIELPLFDTETEG